ncbi:hypothetical protein EI94DRAFT_1704208 [Lactarius quietus]|nr:hypothetical protein EI94DRAFT_1704208 [Lactarius quietus]
MSSVSAGLLATHAAAVLQAQCSVICAYHASVVLPGSIPHPLDIAEREIWGMLAHAVISSEEYQWDILRFASKHYDEDHYDDSVSVTRARRGLVTCSWPFMPLCCLVWSLRSLPVQSALRAKMKRGSSGILKKMQINDLVMFARLT